MLRPPKNLSFPLVFSLQFLRTRDWRGCLDWLQSELAPFPLCLKVVCLPSPYSLGLNLFDYSVHLLSRLDLLPLLGLLWSCWVLRPSCLYLCLFLCLHFSGLGSIVPHFVCLLVPQPSSCNALQSVRAHGNVCI